MKIKIIVGLIWLVMVAMSAIGACQIVDHYPLMSRLIVALACLHGIKNIVMFTIRASRRPLLLNS